MIKLFQAPNIAVAKVRDVTQEIKLVSDLYASINQMGMHVGTETMIVNP